MNFKGKWPQIYFAGDVISLCFCFFSEKAGRTGPLRNVGEDFEFTCLAQI